MISADSWGKQKLVGETKKMYLVNAYFFDSKVEHSINSMPFLFCFFLTMTISVQFCTPKNIWRTWINSQWFNASLGEKDFFSEQFYHHYVRIKFEKDLTYQLENVVSPEIEVSLVCLNLDYHFHKLHTNVAMLHYMKVTALHRSNVAVLHHTAVVVLHHTNVAVLHLTAVVVLLHLKVTLLHHTKVSVLRHFKRSTALAS